MINYIDKGFLNNLCVFIKNGAVVKKKIEEIFYNLPSWTEFVHLVKADQIKAGDVIVNEVDDVLIADPDTASATRCQAYFVDDVRHQGSANTIAIYCRQNNKLVVVDNKYLHKVTKRHWWRRQPVSSFDGPIKKFFSSFVFCPQAKTTKLIMVKDHLVFIITDTKKVIKIQTDLVKQKN